MEEDIKIIEELIEPFREQNRKGKKLILDIKGIKYEHYEAIENLIARNKELEEGINNAVSNETKLIRENTKLRKENQELSEDFISKSKIEEKIEELEKTKFGRCTNTIDILQELLEEE